MIVWDDSESGKVIGNITYFMLIAGWALLTFFLLFFL